MTLSLDPILTLTINLTFTLTLTITLNLTLNLTLTGVTVDAFESTSADSAQKLTYQWTIPTSFEVTNSTLRLPLVALTVLPRGTHEIGLSVTDSEGER